MRQADFTASAPEPGCPLCRDAGGVVIVSGPRWRVIRAQEPDFPAFYRLVWREHVAEFSDLPPEQRHECVAALCAIEHVLRDRLQPTKINLASLGNVVPHLHWHVIARFEWDSHFPQPVWGLAQRNVEPSSLATLRRALPELDVSMGTALERLHAIERD